MNQISSKGDEGYGRLISTIALPQVVDHPRREPVHRFIHAAKVNTYKNHGVRKKSS